jgi:hypothetical protein
MHPRRVNSIFFFIPYLFLLAFVVDPWGKKKSTKDENGKFKFQNSNFNFNSAVKMVKKTGEVFVQKPSEDVPKIFTFDSVYDWK